MSQFYTLEEAASKLKMSVDELRELAKKREVRSFQDRGVLRFKSEDIDARLNAPAVVNLETDSEDFSLNLDDIPTTDPNDNNSPLVINTGDADDFSLSLDDSGIAPPLFDALIANGADSDGLLGIQDTPDLLGSDFSLSTELHSNGPESNSTSSSVILPKDSPFEISEPSIDLDNGGEVQLSENEIDFIPTIDDLHIDGEPSLQFDDSNGSDQGLSSSIELQSESGGDSSEFELSVEESGSDLLSLDGSMSGEGAGTQVVDDTNSSDSEFELNLDEEIGISSDVGSEAGMDSSFELEPSDDDSGSQVVEVDDGNDADPMGATAEFNELEVVEDGSSSQVVAIEEVEEIEEEVVEEVDEVEEFEEADKPLVYAGDAPWGPVPTIFLIPGVLILFVVGLMSLELMRGMYGFNKGTGFTSIIIKPIAEMFTDFPKN